jgi:uncharacterized membrane protein YgcG
MSFLLYARLYLAALVMAMAILAGPTVLSAAEVIQSFHSRIEVEKDGTLLVTENIRVTAEGRNIRRGIYRDFPLLFEDARGRQRQVGFELLGVERDGQADGSRVEKSRSKVRIYIGKEDRFLQPGTYTYTIRYTTDRQIRFFPDHDELYWNVTGNFWNFPVLKASATVMLPRGVRPTGLIGFTGRVGSTEQAVNMSSSDNVVKAEARRRLESGEGLTIAVKMPDNSIAEPTAAQRSAWFWKDNIGYFMAIAGLLLVCGYYFANWWMVGRDPAAGVIVPRWDAPDNISPALVNYIDKKGLAGKGFDAISSAILNLAVKGLVTIDKHADTITVSVNKDVPKPPDLPVGERSILNRLKVTGDQQLTISKSNGATVKKLQQGFATAMEQEHRGKYYEANTLTFIGGVLLSLVVMFLVVFFASPSKEMFEFLFMCGFGTVFFGVFAISLAKKFSSSGNFFGKVVSLIMTGLVSFAVLSSFFASIAVSVIEMGKGPEAWLLMTIVGIIVLNILFYFLLGAPTPLGRKKMDGIEGLRTYLQLAEKDRMNLKGAPDFSVKHFEELLPYAVALGVEKPWSRAFETWLVAAFAAGAVAASTYRPDWYSGRSFDSDSLSDTMSDFTGSMQSGFSSAMPVPKSSSSGFSGGSSGGGGGGGGGGGW